jgi:hypothetical protein
LMPILFAHRLYICKAPFCLKTNPDPNNCPDYYHRLSHFLCHPNFTTETVIVVVLGKCFKNSFPRNFCLKFGTLVFESLPIPPVMTIYEQNMFQRGLPSNLHISKVAIS